MTRGNYTKVTGAAGVLDELAWHASGGCRFSGQLPGLRIWKVLAVST